MSAVTIGYLIVAAQYVAIFVLLMIARSSRSKPMRSPRRHLHAGLRHQTTDEERDR